jgi:hydrogenase nickel incorporation protein HypA/HybF
MAGPELRRLVHTMHELSIALSIVEVAEEEIEKNGGTQVTAVHLKLGPLSGVIRDALLSAYGLACEGTPLAGSRLVIEDVPVIGQCAKCDAPREVNSVEWFVCPECRSPLTEVLQGRELQVVALEIQ